MQECLYQNDSDRMIVLKCIGANKFYREKVVMPTESYWFEAPRDARLEIWQMSLQGQMLHHRADITDYAIEPKNHPEQEHGRAKGAPTAFLNSSANQTQSKVPQH